MLAFQSSLLFLNDCGIRTKQEMELLPCDLTSFYLGQLFTDLPWGRTYSNISVFCNCFWYHFIIYNIFSYLSYYLFWYWRLVYWACITCWLVSNQLTNFFWIMQRCKEFHGLELNVNFYNTGVLWVHLYKRKCVL